MGEQAWNPSIWEAEAEGIRSRPAWASLQVVGSVLHNKILSKEKKKKRNTLNYFFYAYAKLRMQNESPKALLTSGQFPAQHWFHLAMWFH